MRSQLRSARYRLMKMAGRTLDDVVFLEGGLGSQLLGLMLYLQRTEDDPTTRVDTSYFVGGPEEPTDDAVGLTKWPWELHRYGFEVSQFGSVDRRLRVRLSRADQGALDQRFMPLVAQRDWTRDFPIVDSALTELHGLGLSAEAVYGCVHVRRGDYLRVSSRVVGLDEALALCDRVEGLLPESLVFVSDDPFTDAERDSVATRLRGRSCIFATGDDQHAVHGVLRMASVLVTSNSTFSWSAGLLTTRPNAVVLSPQSFFGTDNEDVNRTFQSGSDWMVMRPRR